ncbi:MAG: hypothetical protein QG567_125 [Campylobacterota bacterium]|nr:hypothetical protein [Campylobacterota bacterium]
MFDVTKPIGVEIVMGTIVAIVLLSLLGVLLVNKLRDK